MTEETKAIVPIDKTTGQLAPTDLEGMWRIACIMANSEMVPSDYRKKPEKCFVAMQLGMEVGLGYMASIQTISVINGKPAIYGDGVPAIVQARGKCKKWDEFYILKDEMKRADRNKHYAGPANLSEWPDELTAVCVLYRDGFEEPFEGYFSVADAKRMGKWNTPDSHGSLSVWQKYPLRMLKMRARGFAARDGFSDHLKGIGIVEELMDIPAAEIVNKVEVPVKKDPMDAILEGDVVEATTAPQEERSPQETPLSDPEEAIKHPIVLDLESKRYNPELIGKFITWAAENNDMDEVSLMNEAMADIDGFEISMVQYGNKYRIPKLSGEAVDENIKADIAFEKAAKEEVLKESIKKSAASCQSACQMAGKAMDEADIPTTGRMIATEDGVFDQEGNRLDPNADIDGWVKRFVQSYRLKNKHQYSPFVLSSEDKFRQLFQYAPTLYDKAVEKWTKFYGDEPWPVVLNPGRDNVGESEPIEVAADPEQEQVDRKINEAARIFTNEEKMTHTEKFTNMKQLFPNQVKKAIENLKLGNGALSAPAVEVLSFAVKEIIAAEKRKEKKNG